MQAILTRYSNLPGNGDLVFKTLCALLSEQSDKVDWPGFTSLDWALFEKMAVDEGVAPMAYYVLMTMPEEYHLVDFNKRTYQVLSEQEAINAIRNAILFKHLGKILQILQGHEIPVVLLKGADLAQTLYPQPGLRRMADLDILVQESHFKSALALMNSLGYHENIPEAAPGLNWLINRNVQLFMAGKVPVVLELHRSLISTLAYRYGVPMDWFWQNLNTCNEWADEILLENKNSIYTLNPTSNLLYLASHQMLQHGGEFVALYWLLDLHRLVKCRSREIDWTALAAQANDFSWSSALRSALMAAQACFATSLPEGLLSTLVNQSGQFDSLVELKALKTNTRIIIEWKKLSSLNWYGRMRLILALIFPAPSYMLWRYHPRPKWVWPLYYVYRWFDIAQDITQTFKQLLHISIKKT